MVAVEPPDVVVCDLVLSGADGITLTRQLAEMQPAIPVIIVTGRGSEGDAERAFEAGARDVVTKPIESMEWGPALGQRACAVLTRDATPSPTYA